MGLKLAPVLVRRLLGSPFLSRPIAGASWTQATLNRSNKRYNAPPAAHPPSPPTPPPPAHPPPYTVCATCDTTVAVKKVAQNPSVSYVASRNNYKLLAKNCSSYTVNLAWLQSSIKEPQWFQYLKFVILKISNVTIWVILQNQVTYVVNLALIN